jgi:hypothetical protein
MHKYICSIRSLENKKESEKVSDEVMVKIFPNSDENLKPKKPKFNETQVHQRN